MRELCSFLGIILFAGKVRDQGPPDADAVHFLEQIVGLERQFAVYAGVAQTHVGIKYVPIGHFTKGQVNCQC